ncbi:MAG: PAS domain-containing protein [Burkholderiaceae bacterium]|nr:PAS domain-containing protein [Burkholderiaceae bacterium]
MLLSFERLPDDETVPRDSDVELLAHDVEHQRRIEALERELSLTHDSLQATIEELETSNEELQATNEELMASNEELQSTNEELQSVNEELYTVNAEYQEKVDILNSVNADLENVSKAAAIPTLFVDDALCLTRFTPEAAQLFKVREGDVGRSIEDFANQLDYPELFVDLRRTLKTGVVTEREVPSRNGEWWLARIQPYLGPAQAGATRAVMTFFNVTSVKDSQRLQAIIDSLSEHLAVVDARGPIMWSMPAWPRFAQSNGDHDLALTGPGTDYLQACTGSAPRDAAAQRAYDGLADVLAGRAERFSLRYPCHSPTEQRWFLMHAARMPGNNLGAVVSHVNITPFMGSATAQAGDSDDGTKGVGEAP